MIDLNESLKQVRELYEDGAISIDTAIETSLLLIEKVDFDDTDLPQAEKINNYDADYHYQSFRTEEWRYCSIKEIQQSLENFVDYEFIKEFLFRSKNIQNLAMVGFGDGGVQFYRNEELFHAIEQLEVLACL
jgi:hypothetical protein